VEAGATLGGRLGFNVRDGAANTVMNDSDLKNSAISISAAGALSGAGGGSITPLPADYLIDGSTYGRYALTERTKLGNVENGATLGGRFGTNIRDSGATLLNDGDVKNSAITLGAGGALGGAGGGQISALDFAYIAGGTKPQNNADVTANSQVLATVSTMLNISADYTGTIPSGTLPTRTIDPIVTLGGVDKTHDNLTGYSIVNASGGCVSNITVDNGTGSATKGRQTIGTGLTTSGAFQLQITYNGVNLPPVTVTVTVTRGAAPTTSSGGTSGSFTTTGRVNNGGFVETNRVSGLTLASGKALYAYFGGDYDNPGTAGSRSVQGKWQYTTAGGSSWTDFAAYVQGSGAASDYGGAGTITCNQSVVGLAAASYDVRFVANLSNTGSVIWSNASGSVSIS
jgi:hypothetical protein